MKGVRGMAHYMAHYGIKDTNWFSFLTLILLRIKMSFIYKVTNQNITKSHPTSPIILLKI